MPAPFTFDRTWAFPVSAGELWSRLARTDEYTHWWPWLRSFETDGTGLAPGVVASCVVRGPLPYTLRFDVAVEEVVPPELVVTTVHGDLHGPARLELRDAAGTDGVACSARLAWRVELRAPVVRRVAVATRPAMVWAHDRVVEGGMQAFRRAALDGDAP